MTQDFPENACFLSWIPLSQAGCPTNGILASRVKVRFSPLAPEGLLASCNHSPTPSSCTVDGLFCRWQEVLEECGGVRLFPVRTDDDTGSNLARCCSLSAPPSFVTTRRWPYSCLLCRAVHSFEPSPISLLVAPYLFILFLIPTSDLKPPCQDYSLGRSLCDC
jgi:hypothetical protein